MIDKVRLNDELTIAFIRYQENLDNPMMGHLTTEKDLEIKYMSNTLFRNKVLYLVSGVMRIVCDNIDKAGAQ